LFYFYFFIFYFFYFLFKKRTPRVAVPYRTAGDAMAACSLEPCRLHSFLFCTTTFLHWFLVFRLDCFGLPLDGALVVFKVLLDGHNPQDVATSLGGGGWT
jgi:hypothetical protein